jgi:spermidine/putrescine transport system ATP-binding protein
VASFLGASNLIRLQAVTLNGDRATVDLGAGRSAIVPRSALSNHGDHHDLSLGVRPEKLSIIGRDASVPPGYNALVGQVRVATFTGVGNHYVVITEGSEELTVYVQNLGDAAAPRTGEDVQVIWSAEHAFVVAGHNEGEPEAP